MYLIAYLNFLSLYMLLNIKIMSKVIFLLYSMSKDTIQVYNISSDTESTYIADEESTDDEYIINNNNKTNVFLNFSLELERFYFNNISVNVNLNIPLFKNVSRPLCKKYNLLCCNIDDNENYYYYIKDSVKNPNGSILINLMSSQLGID